MASVRKMIEQRAYELFLKRGGIHGYHMEDWLRAEKEIAGGGAGNNKTETRLPVATKKVAPAPAFNASSSSRRASTMPRKRK